MSYVTFGDVQRRAIAAGLVMSRRPKGIFLRYRSASDNQETWSGLDASGALKIVKSEELREALRQAGIA